MATTLSKLGLAAGIASMVLTGPAMAQPSGSEARTVEGTWFIQVTLRNCVTSVPLGPPINSLVTFHPGGTLTEAPAATGFAPGQRTGGQGNWSHQGGQTYAQRFVALIAFPTPPGPGGPGFETGWQTVTQAVSLLDRDHLESAGTNAFYRTDGTTYRTGCSTATGTRFE